MPREPGDSEARSNLLPTLWFAARVNVFAIVLSAVWTPLNTILLPDMIDDLAPTALRGSVLGLVTFVGIGAAVVIQPLAGLISDRRRSADRRRPFIVPSAVMMAVGLLAIAVAPGLWWLLAAYVALQVAGNVAQAAFQALIPDLVPEDDHGEASGVKNALDLLGTLLGLAGVGLLVMLGISGRIALPLLALAAIGGAVAVWRWVPVGRDGQDRPAAGRRSIVLDAFAPLVRGSRAFKLVLATRFLFLLGLYPVQRFLLYFLEDRFEVDDPVTRSSLAILAAVLLGALASATAGVLADRTGPMSVLTGSVILAAAGVLGVALAPSLLLVGVAGGVAAVGAGAFMAVNWAMIAGTIPPAEGARYYGIANITTAGASATVGLLGPLVDLTSSYVPEVTYPVTFALGAACILAALLPLKAGSGTRQGAAGTGGRVASQPGRTGER